jgi:hypothetical protein
VTVRIEVPDDARDDLLAVLLSAQAELLGEIRRHDIQATAYADRRGDKVGPMLDQARRRHDLVSALIEQVRG